MSQPGLWQLLAEETSPSLSTAASLARVEGVSLETILASPRDRAAALAREAGIPEAAVRRVLSEPDEDEDVVRPVLWYIDRMRASALLHGDAPPPPPASTRRGAA